MTVLVAAPVTALVVTLSLAASRSGPEPVTHPYLFPADYHGPVWVRFPETTSTLDVRIIWGEWTYSWTVRPDDSRTYRFAKDKPRPGDENVPVRVVVAPDVATEFGYGTFPDDAVALPSEWDALDPSSAD